MEAEEALQMLGKYGRYQIIFFIILSIGMMTPSCWHVLAYMFQAYTPKHHCVVPNSTDRDTYIPWDDQTDTYSSCLVYNQTYNVTMSCSDVSNEWTYYDDDVNDTIVSDWDLVCERDYMKRMTSTVTALGIVIGTMIFPPLMDLFGRKPVFLATTWTMVAVGLWNVFVTNYYEYIVVRLLTGVLRPGYDLSAFVMACELFPARQRTFAGIIIEDFWGLSICVLALLMFLISNWRYLQLFISLFGLLSIPLYWYLPESVPWLISKGRVEEAEKVIQKAARINGIRNFPERVFTSESREIVKLTSITANEDLAMGNFSANGDSNKEPISKEAKKVVRGIRGYFFRKSDPGKPGGYTIFDVLHHSRLRWFLLATSFLWFISSVVYYGMTLNTEELAGNRYLNLFISGLVEIPAYTLSYFVINRYGRRLPLVAIHLLAGASLIASQFVPRTSSPDGLDLVALRIALVMVGKFCITSAFAICYLFTPELFPTTVRSQSVGIAVVLGRTGGMLAPFTSSLDDIEPWLSSVVFGVVSIFGGLVALALPETNKRPLPQTIGDIERWYRNPRQSSVEHH